MIVRRWRETCQRLFLPIVQRFSFLLYCMVIGDKVYITMLRTQIYVPQQLYRLLQAIAKKDNVPTAEVVREVLIAGIAKKQGNVGQGLMQLASIKGKGPADLSQNIDKYLYEE